MPDVLNLPKLLPIRVQFWSWILYETRNLIDF